MSGSVAIRGAGVVCALGVGTDAVDEAVTGGREFEAFRSPSDSRPAYPAPFDPLLDLPLGRGRRLGRQLAMSLAATLDAIGSDRAWSEDPSDTGIVAATAHGPIHETVYFIDGARRDGAQYASPLLFSCAQHGSMAGVASRELGIRGPALVVSNGDVSFETALLTAVSGLRAGRMRRTIVVGADAFHPLYVRSLAAFGLVTDSRHPVDPEMRHTTRGFHVGEGAGALVLEWDEDGGEGVHIDDVVLGASASIRGVEPADVQVMASGDSSSARRHADALAALSLADARVSYPAARFGAFPSLSAVAIAVEAARRLASATDDGPTLFITAPRETNAASVVLAGCGSG